MNQTPDLLDIESQSDQQSSQPIASRLRKLVLTVSVEYVVPEPNQFAVLKDNLEAIADEIVKDVNANRLTQGTVATVDLKAYGVREEKV